MGEIFNVVIFNVEILYLLFEKGVKELEDVGFIEYEEI